MVPEISQIDQYSKSDRPELFVEAQSHRLWTENSSTQSGYETVCNFPHLLLQIPTDKSQSWPKSPAAQESSIRSTLIEFLIKPTAAHLLTSHSVRYWPAPGHPLGH